MHGVNTIMSRQHLNIYTRLVGMSAQVAVVHSRSLTALKNRACGSPPHLLTPPFFPCHWDCVAGTAGFQVQLVRMAQDG